MSVIEVVSDKPANEDAGNVKEVERVQFSSLALDDRLLSAVEKLGWKFPTLIQEKGIPLALAGRDLLARARTGSGKTATYALPIINRILLEKQSKSDSKRCVRALLLVPTKELCEQVNKQVRELTLYCSKLVTVTAVSSTVAVSAQKSALLQASDILIGTPTRILAHIDAGNLDVSGAHSVVVDEADLLFSFGYENDVRTLLAHLTVGYQSYLMSATMTKDVEALREIVQTNPAVLRLNESHLPEDSRLAQHIIRCEDKDKYLILYSMLAFKLVKGKILLFVNSINEVYKLKLFLDHFSIKACVLNSELPHNSRQHIVQEFNRGVYDIIIASDENSALDDEEDSDDEENVNVLRGPQPISCAVVVEDGNDSNESVSENGRIKSESESENESENESDEEIEVEHATDVSKEAGKALAQTAGQKKKKKKNKKSDFEYGVTRGVDFNDVNWVVNVDFPMHANAYIHRVGRTARAGKAGNAISFLTCPEHRDILQRIEKKLKIHNVETSKKESVLRPYAFSMAKIKGLRYRVEAAEKTITRGAIKQARLKEIRTEILNSDKLKAYFVENPRDLQVLRHNEVLDAKRVNVVVKHIPSYLMPSRAALMEEKEALYAGTQPITSNTGFSHAKNLKSRHTSHRKSDDNSSSGNIKRKFNNKGGGHKRRGSSDPLKSFSVKRARK
eukprot:CFRG1099T1